MKKFITLIFACCILVQWSQAQEEAVLMHYQINPLLINPATAGFDAEHHKLFINTRTQWTGFPGAPKTYSVSYNGPIGKRLGIGALLYAESIGNVSSYRAQLSYAFRYDIEDRGLSFALGLSTEFHEMRLNNSSLDNPLYDAGDEVVGDAEEGVKAFDASLGFTGSYKKNTFFGIALPNLIRNRLDNIGVDSTSNSFIQYFTLHAGHKFEVSNSFSLEPSFLLKKVRNVPFQFDINLKASFLDEKLIGGVSYRATTGNLAGLPEQLDGVSSFGVLIGTKYQALRFFYSYDVFLDEFQSFNGGSHEITIGFEFGRSDKNKNK